MQFANNVCQQWNIWGNSNWFTSRDSLWTSVTSHHAHAQPPTRVFLAREPQQPPEIIKIAMMEDFHIVIYG